MIVFRQRQILEYFFFKKYDSKEQNTKKTEQVCDFPLKLIKRV